MDYTEAHKILEERQRTLTGHYGVRSADEKLIAANGLAILALERQIWIDIDERLPPKSGKYIVCNRSGAVYQTKYYSYPKGTGGHWGQKDKGKNIIAWMPMPEPMKAGD